MFLGLAACLLALPALAEGEMAHFVIGARGLLTGAGVLATGIIELMPFLGWLFAMAMVLTGVGAISLRVIRPSFFVGDE